MAYAELTLDRYRDNVTELMKAGAPFGTVEEAIEEFPHASEEVKAGLWLLAFSMRDPDDPLSEAHAHLASVPPPQRGQARDRVELATVIFWVSASVAVALMVYLGVIA